MCISSPGFRRRRIAWKRKAQWAENWRQTDPGSTAAGIRNGTYDFPNPVLIRVPDGFSVCQGSPVGGIQHVVEASRRVKTRWSSVCRRQTGGSILRKSRLFQGLAAPTEKKDTGRRRKPIPLQAARERWLAKNLVPAGKRTANNARGNSRCPYWILI